MFRLADIVPVVNPVKGGETGESFSELYEKALRLMDIRSFDKMSKEEHERYNKSIAYLAEVIQDPQNFTNNVTRFALYARLRKKYVSQLFGSSLLYNSFFVLVKNME